MQKSKKGAAFGNSIVKRGPYVSFFKTVPETFLATPLLPLAFALFSVWNAITLQGVQLTPLFWAQSITVAPSWIVPMVGNGLMYLVFGLLYFFKRIVPRGRRYQTTFFVLMGTSVVLLEYLSTHTTGSAALDIILFVVGGVAIGATTACLYLELGKIFGILGPKKTAIHGTIGLLITGVFLMILEVSPTFILVIFTPCIPIILLIIFLFGGFPTKRTGKTIEETKVLYIPWKLVVTVLIQATSFGIMQSIIIANNIHISMVIASLGFLITAVILMVTIMFVKMDFNQLIYQAGFPLMAIGFLFVTLPGSWLLVGEVILLIGYRFLLLLTYILCSYLVKQCNLSANWVYPWATIPLSIGQIIGPTVGNATINAFTTNYEGISFIATFSIAVLLIGALFMANNSNVRTGWGVIRPGADQQSSGTVEEACILIRREYDLTSREGEILLLLARGRSIPAIGDNLIISQETVKTHVKSIYAKLGVHTRQELLDLVEHEVGELQHNEQEHVATL